MNNLDNKEEDSIVSEKEKKFKKILPEILVIICFLLVIVGGINIILS